MTSSLVSADSLLAIDIGTTTTRAMLFDVVDGRYHFLAAGSAVTTAGAPYRDIGEGVRRALDQLQEISGRLLLRDDESIIIPSASDGSGVDGLAATISAGPPLKVVAVGLLEGVSKVLHPGGILVCAGMLRGNTHRVEAGMAAVGFTIINAFEKNGWVGIAAALKP